MVKLEKLPYLLRAFILFALFGGVAGLGGAVFDGLTTGSLGAIALGVVGLVVWKACDNWEYRHPQKVPKRASAVAKVATSSSASGQASAADDAARIRELAKAQYPPFTDSEVDKLRQFSNTVRISFGTPSFHAMRTGGWMYDGHETISSGYHDEYEGNHEAICFERPTGWNTQGDALSAGDVRNQKIAFITKRAKAAVILRRGGRYHIIAEEFLGIPGITVISYEKQHSEDSFVEDLL